MEKALSKVVVTLRYEAALEAHNPAAMDAPTAVAGAAPIVVVGGGKGTWKDASTIYIRGLARPVLGALQRRFVCYAPTMVGPSIWNAPC